MGGAAAARGERSRVTHHDVIVELGGTLWAIDTASHNGSFLGTRQIRSTRLEPGQPLTLADAVSLEWRPFH